MYAVSKEFVEKELTCANGHIFKKDLPTNIYGDICQKCGHPAMTKELPDRDWKELDKMMEDRKIFNLASGESTPIELP
jgi:hypothetical protein